MKYFYSKNNNSILQPNKQTSKQQTANSKQQKRTTKMEFNKKMQVYIPLMNSVWANEDKIKQLFKERMMGNVKKVRIVKKRSTKKETGYVHSAFVELDWFQNNISVDMQNKMNAPGIVTDSKLMLDEKWYFLLLNKNKFWRNK